MKIAILLLLILTSSGVLALNHPRFGQLPRGKRLEKLEKSPNYVKGQFKNLHETEVMTTEKGHLAMMGEFMSQKKIRLAPEAPLPVTRTDVKTLNAKTDLLIWLGHSSYYFQLNGRKFLVDPVFSSYASPLSFINKAYAGTTVYSAEDFADIDYLIITHDHWDHLDYKSVMDLKAKVKHVVCGLGVGQHFERWGYEDSVICELDWYDEMKTGDGWTLAATPARHFSGRGLKRNRTLWASFALISPDFRIFIGGDGGYDTFFTEIGEKYGPFDVAVLEQGQYNKNWSLIHLAPEKLLAAAKPLRAGRVLPVHNSRFTLSRHPWDEPLKKAIENLSGSDVSVMTPRMGDVVFLKDSKQHFDTWWEKVEASAGTRTDTK